MRWLGGLTRIFHRGVNRSLDFARDFGSGLRPPLNASIFHSRSVEGPGPVVAVPRVLCEALKSQSWRAFPSGGIATSNY